MVKKLFKHEFISYARIMGIVYLILFTVAAAGRIIQFFESDSTAYSIVFTITCITYVISAFAAMVFAFVLGIVRFYKNLFTAEGYLTLTLPVTPTQHILVKAVTAVSMQLISYLMIGLSFCIITAGDMLSEIWKAGIYLLQKLYEYTGIQGFVIGGEFAILFIMGLFSGMMLYYTFISIGQLARKNRILAAVGAYFAFYILSQIVSTVLMVMLSILSATGAFDAFGTWLVNALEQYPYRVIHCTLWISILLVAIGILVEFLITRRIITKKLNLE